MDGDYQQLWKKILLSFKSEVSIGNYAALFKQTSLISLQDGVATIGAANIMMMDMLQKRFSKTIKERLDKLTGQTVELLFVINAQRPLVNEGFNHAPLFIEHPAQPVQTIGHLPRVRSDFTFGNFAVSGSNQLAFVSSQSVANKLGAAYNPFFIYGPVGVGKTHLMHAIANEAYQKQPDRKIIYTTSEEFTNEVVEAIKTNETAKMKRRFRSVLLLLIDDIQFIEGKMVVQEELFHTFNILIDQGSQIVFSSDRPPEEIKKIEKRLSSRFAGGLAVNIEPPDFELKTAIVLIKARKYEVDLPIEAAKILAEQASDARSLEGLLLKMMTISSTQNIPLSKDLAKEAIGKTAEENRGHLHAEDIFRVVCAFYDIKPTLLRGPKRDASLVKARQVAMYLLKTKLGLTHEEIGNLLGGRDHTTIMYGVDKIEKLVDSKAMIAEDIFGITKQLNV
jgi:chromosomal replication initiator protein